MKLSSNATRWFAAALAMMTASASWAEEGGGPGPGPGPGGGTSAEATATGFGIASGTANAVSKNTNKNTNTNTSANKNTNTSANKNTNVNGAAGGGAAINLNTVNSTDVSRTVPNVYSPALAAAGYEVCLGSVSAGGAASGFGLSLGGTYEDKSCQARLNAKTLATLGYVAAAREVMCQDPHIRIAMRNAGTPCVAQACWNEFNLFTGWQQVCGP